MQSFRIPAPINGLTLHLACQPAAHARGDVLYVHGATFPSDLSLFFRFDGRSWADALNEAGFNAWGLDFLGYGRSDRYPGMAEPAEGQAPLGTSEQTVLQLAEAVAAIRIRNGGRAIGMVAHSWGTAVAARFAAQQPETLQALVLFGPVALRRMDLALPPPLAHRTLTLWEQYRRFIEDVPRGHPPMLLDRHIEAWSRAYLATDAESGTRMPPAVRVPAGPGADIMRLWNGQPLFDAHKITTPLLVVRGEWDSVTNDDDAATLLASVGSTIKQDRKLARGTHLMHLEESRGALHQATNEFLGEHMG